MAGVMAPGIGRQVALVAGLRWRLFRNSLRSTSAWLDLVSVLLTSLLGGLFLVTTGVGLGAAAHFVVAHGTPELLALPLLAVFIFWQVVPLFLASSATGFDFRYLLRFPVRFPAFFLLALAYGLFDPASLGALFWLTCITTGIVTARAELLPWTLLVLAVYAVTNLLLSRMVFSWLERLLARRRSRELLVALFLLCVMSLQLFSAVGARWGRRVRPWVRPYAVAALPALKMFPPGLAGGALEGGARGSGSAVLVSTALLAAYGAAFGLLLHRRLRAQYLGEDLSEAPAPLASAARASASVTSSTALGSFLPGPVAAIVEKELHYLYRNTMAALNLVVPLILIVFFSLSANAPRQRPSPLARYPELAFPAAVAYMFLIVTPLVHNSFAFDGHGIRLLFVAPVRFRDVLLGKNLVFALILTGETGLVWLMVTLLFRAPGLLTVAATLSGLLFATLVHLILGNWLSLEFPRRFEFGQFRRRASGTAVLIGLLSQFILLGLATGVTLLARYAGGKMWLVPVVFLSLCGLAVPAYAAMLNQCTRLAIEKREVLTSQLCREHTG